MSERYAAVAVTSCLVAGLLTVSSSVTAHAAECLSGPNAQSGPGTYWRYRINHATGQRCWYLKRVRRSCPIPSLIGEPGHPPHPPHAAQRQLGAGTIGSFDRNVINQGLVLLDVFGFRRAREIRHEYRNERGVRER